MNFLRLLDENPLESSDYAETKRSLKRLLIGAIIIISIEVAVAGVDFFYQLNRHVDVAQYPLFQRF